MEENGKLQKLLWHVSRTSFAQARIINPFFFLNSSISATAYEKDKVNSHNVIKVGSLRDLMKGHRIL